MIDEYWTWQFYGYHSDEIGSCSRKPIVARCDGCCQYRVLKPGDYRDLCKSCVGKNRTFSEERNRKISLSHLGEKNPNYGKHPSDETRLAMSLSHTGEKNYFFGKHHTEETKHKISDAKIGISPSEDARHNMSEAHMGNRNESQRGGHDIVNHHIIYDCFDPLKYTMKMTRKEHSTLHYRMQRVGLKAPCINMNIADMGGGNINSDAVADEIKEACVFMGDEDKSTAYILIDEYCRCELEQEYKGCYE